MKNLKLDIKAQIFKSRLIMRQTVYAMIIAQFAFSPLAYGSDATVDKKEDYVLFQTSATDVAAPGSIIDDTTKEAVPETAAMRPLGQLPAGSVIGIPKRYFEMAREDMVKRGQAGKIKMDLVYYHWLRHDEYVLDEKGEKVFENGVPVKRASGAGAYLTPDGQEDEFYPVKIITPGKGANLDLTKGEETYIPLKKISLTQVTLDEDALKKAGEDLKSGNQEVIDALKTNDMTSFYKPVQEATFGNAASTEAQGDCLQCHAQSDNSPSVTNLKNFLNSHIANDLDAERAGLMKNRDRRIIESANELGKDESCGLQFNDFKQIIDKDEASDEQVQPARLPHIPTSIMMSLMTRESGGNCFSRSKTNDVGLFQIHVSAKNGRLESPYGTPVCSALQRSVIHNNMSAYSNMTNPQARAEKLAALQSPSLKCVENPIVGLREAKQIIRDKVANLKHDGFDFAKMNKQNAWLITMAAYNGGERPLERAKALLESFNSKYGSHLDAKNWRDLRIFIAQQSLNERFQVNKQKLSTIAYAESIVGLPGSKQEGLADAWTAQLLKY